ncbi:MAG: protein translocase subunit SecD [Rhodospirillaceae bacterium]|nr:protein translocase subunit SecD [Rhodospirillaceae bacterium]
MLKFPTWKKVLILVVCGLGVLYSLPNFFKEGTFDLGSDWLPGKRMNLGLDLRGGLHLLMDVDVDSVFKQQMENLKSTVRIALRAAKARSSGIAIRGNSVLFKLNDPNKIDAVRERLRENVGNLEFDVDDNGAFEISYSQQFRIDQKEDILNRTVEIIRIRVDPDGTLDAAIQRQGEKRILVQVPGGDETIKERFKPAKLTIQKVNRMQLCTEAPKRARGGTQILRSDDTAEGGAPICYTVEKRVRVGGEHVTDAAATYHENRPAVSFRFDTVGARRFCRASRENVNRQLAIILDSKVISAPVINEPICQGNGVISGNFTIKEAQNLALLIRVGALPAGVTFLEERSVGPGLGRDAIEAGKTASIIGFVLVLIFMVVVYGRFGIMADVALFVNVGLLVALLSALQATLTLPGIAGIVLTVGMAVDANVLIFERIREELLSGRTPMNAVEAGYSRALVTIIDSNLTTLIAAVLLYAFGSGPVQGFAVTLTFGIITSMFTAIMVTRLMVVTWLRAKRPTEMMI